MYSPNSFMPKNTIYGQGSTTGPTEETYSTSQDPLAGGEKAASPSPRTTPLSQPSALMFGPSGLR